MNSLVLIIVISVSFWVGSNGEPLDPDTFDMCTESFCLGILEDEKFVGTGGCISKKNCEFLFVVQESGLSGPLTQIRWRIYAAIDNDIERGAWIRFFVLDKKIEGLEDVPDLVPHAEFFDVDHDSRDSRVHVRWNGTLYRHPYTLNQKNLENDSGYQVTNGFDHPYLTGSGKEGNLTGWTVTEKGKRSTIIHEGSKEKVYDIDLYNDPIYPYIAYNKKKYTGPKGTKGGSKPYETTSVTFVTTEDAIVMTKRDSYMTAKFKSLDNEAEGKKSIGWLVVLCIILGLLIAFMCISCVIQRPKGSGHSSLASKQSTTDGLTTSKDSKSKGETSDGAKKVDPSVKESDVKAKTETKA